MAEVWLARKDGDLVDRDLVVKRMLPHLAEDARFVQLFLREARIAARLCHPNVVQVLDVGQGGGEYFIAMEFLDGLSALQLAKRVWASGRALPLPVVAQVICDAALGLHHAHMQRTDDGQPGNLVHRDVSPDNLLVTRTGTTKVLDFGIAAGAFVGRVTRTGEIKGKVRYMSPEQVAGEDLDARTDVWALGATLYWLLTGRHAFTGKGDLQLMRAVVEVEPPPPSQVNSQIPGALDGLVMRMLAKPREARTASAEAVYEAMVPWAGARGQHRVADVVALAMDVPEPEPQPVGEGGPEATPPLDQPATVFRSGDASATDDDAELPQVDAVALVEPGAAATSTGASAADIGVAATDPDEAPTRSGVSMLEATVREGARAALSEDTRADGDEVRPPIRPRSRPWVLAAAGVPVLAVIAALLVVTKAPSGGGADVDAGAVPVPTAPADSSDSPDDPGTAMDAGGGVVTRAGGDDGDADVAAPRAERRVTVRAPPHIQWRVRGRMVGRGDATLTLQAGTARITAVDTQLGGQIAVPVAPVIDWARLPKGDLSFIVLPWADVTLGNKALGRTPRAGPITLVAGRYEVTLSSGSKTRKVKVEVPAGGAAVVRETFLE